jgi:hypothetical protein
MSGRRWLAGIALAAAAAGLVLVPRTARTQPVTPQSPATAAPSAAVTTVPTNAGAPPAGTSPQPAPPPAPATAAPAPTPAATPVPPGPAAAATAVPTPAPFKVVYRAQTPQGLEPSGAPPQINEIDMNDDVLITPCEIHVQVLTNSTVTTVSAQALGRSITLGERAAGVFAFDGYLPQAPFFLRRTYSVAVVASDSGGRAQNVTIPVAVR